jgi:iron-sulfur cluster repair protein YtfE (RIC family)
MPATLPRVSHGHRERLLHHLDQIPGIGRLTLTAPSEELVPRLHELNGWLSESLVPHMETAEATLYPELERMFQNRHSMSPMRREHAEIRRLIGLSSELTARMTQGHDSIGTKVALRRAIFQLYALLEIHLAEEELYIHIIDHGVSEEAGEALAAALDHAGMQEA